jgi:hypothetical protein
MMNPPLSPAAIVRTLVRLGYTPGMSMLAASIHCPPARRAAAVALERHARGPLTLTA